MFESLRKSKAEYHHDNCAFGPVAINRVDMAQNDDVVIDVGCSQSAKGNTIVVFGEEATGYLMGKCPLASKRVAIELGCASCKNYWPIEKIGGLIKDDAAKKFAEELEEELAGSQPFMYLIGK